MCCLLLIFQNHTRIRMSLRALGNRKCDWLLDRKESPFLPIFIIYIYIHRCVRIVDLKKYSIGSEYTHQEEIAFWRARSPESNHNLRNAWSDTLGYLFIYYFWRRNSHAKTRNQILGDGKINVCHITHEASHKLNPNVGRGYIWFIVSILPRKGSCFIHSVCFLL